GVILDEGWHQRNPDIGICVVTDEPLFVQPPRGAGGVKAKRMAKLRRQSVWGFTVKRSSGRRASLLRHECERRQSAVGETLTRWYEPINDFKRREDSSPIRPSSEHEGDPEEVRQHLVVPGQLAPRLDLHQRGDEGLPMLLCPGRIRVWLAPGCFRLLATRR